MKRVELRITLICTFLICTFVFAHAKSGAKVIQATQNDVSVVSDRYSGNSCPNQRGNLKNRYLTYFNLNELPANAKIKRAKVIYKVRDSQRGCPSYEVRAISTNWNRSSLKWNRQPRYTAYRGKTYLRGSQRERSADVTQLLNHACDNDRFYGFMLKSNDESRRGDFELVDAPRLVVEYDYDDDNYWGGTDYRTRRNTSYDDDPCPSRRSRTRTNTSNRKVKTRVVKNPWTKTSSIFNRSSTKARVIKTKVSKPSWKKRKTKTKVKKKKRVMCPAQRNRSDDEVTR